jgi:predicted ABC-type ATPase
MKIGFLMCGPSGVGKTSHVDQMLKNAGFNMKFVRIDPDAQDANTHFKQSQMAMESVAKRIREGKSFVYTATCGGLKNIMEMLKDMKNKGYRTIVAIPYTSVGTALERISKRIEQPVPEEVVKELHAFFAKKAEKYMDMPNLDEVYLYNNEKDFNLLLSMKDKKILCSSDSDFYFDISKYCVKSP